MQVEIWSDVVCPWCYVGKRRFEGALARFAHRDQVQVRWRSFELDPAAVGTAQGAYVDRLAGKYGRSVGEAQAMLDSMTATAAQEGLVFHFAGSRPGSTFDAHRLLHLAAAQGRQDALEERLFRATFTEGEAVAEHDVLARLAAEVGVRGAEDALTSGAHAADVRADEAEAQALGVSGVPFFVVDRRYGVSGAQSPEVLLQVLERAWQDRAPLSLVGGSPAAGAGPGCDADGCAVEPPERGSRSEPPLHVAGGA